MNRRDFIRCMGSGAATALVLPEVLAAQQQRAPALRLADVTAAAGLQFRHNSGAFGGKLLPETMGAGCAFLDYDADGWQDVLLVNGMDWPGHKRERSTLRLYRNNRDGTFTDVTRAAARDPQTTTAAPPRVDAAHDPRTGMVAPTPVDAARDPRTGMAAPICS